MLLEAEQAYRAAFLTAARMASQWDFPDLDAIEAAWEERREACRQVEVMITSAQLFGDPRFDEYDPPGMHIVYRRGHEIEASRTRGKVQAMEIAKLDWWDLADLGLDDDEEIRQAFMRPWVEAVARWADQADDLMPPPRPLDHFTPVQWRLVLSKQQGHECVFNSVEEAQSELRRRQGPWSWDWGCLDVEGEPIGRVYRWERRLGDIVRLAVRHGDRWTLHEDDVRKVMLQPIRPITRRLVAMVREQLDWLWPGRIPLGKLTLLVGEPKRPV